MNKLRIFRITFLIAGIYNLIWGTVAILYPSWVWDLLEMPPMRYPFLMSGIGLFVALYGYGYIVAAQDLKRYPALIFIGFLGKFLGPIGWAWFVIKGDLPLSTMMVNLTNDLVWLPVFAWYLVWAWKEGYWGPGVTRNS